MAIPGDIVKVNRGFYYHYGIYSSPGYVIHFSGSIEDVSSNLENIKVIETSLDFFLKGGQLIVVNLDFDHQLCLNRAKSMLGVSKPNGSYYNLINNNCEHFAYYCATGEFKSSQVDNVINLLKKLF